MANLGGNDVEVKFGGSTADLDAASNKAVADVGKVSKSATGLNGAFAKAQSGFKGFIGEIKGGWAEGWAEGLKQAKEGIGEVGNEALSSGNKMEGMLGVVGKMIPAMAAIGAIAGVGKILEWGAEFGDVAERLDQTAAKLGLTTTQVSQWNALAVTSGLNTEAFASSAGKLERSMVMAANGGKQQSAAFKALGIDITKTTNTSDALLQISDKFATMADGPKKTALAMATLGRTGAELIPILNGGRTALEEQFKTADELGAVVNDRFMEAGRAVDEASDQMTLGMQGVQNTLFTELGPAIAATINWLTGMIKGFIESYRAGGVAKTMIDAIVISFKAIVTVLMTVATGFTQLWHIAVAALQGILGTIYTVGSALGKLLSGDFSGVRDAWVNGFKGTGAAMSVEFDKALTAGKKYRTNMQALWNGPDSKGPKPGPAPDTDLTIPGMGGAGKKGPKGKSAEQLAAEARRVAEKALQDQLEDLQYQQDQERNNYDARMALEDQKLAKLKAFYGEDSREYIKELRVKAKMEQDHALEVVRINQQTIQNLAQLEETRNATVKNLGDIRLQSERDHFDALDNMGLVSSAQRISQARIFAQREQALAVENENTIYAIKSQALRDQLALMNLPVEERRRLDAQLQQMEVEHQGKMAEIQARAAASTQKINDTAAAQTLAHWQGIVDPIAGAFNGFLNSMETRSATFGQALLAMGDQILQSFISMGVKELAHWVSLQLAKTSATAVGVATRTGVEATGAATSNAISAASTLKQIAHFAVKAAAGAYSAIAGIPIVGPILAPIAAAAALYGVYRLGKSVFSAEGGDGEVQQDGAQYTLHKKEMVLPAKYANPLRSMLTGAGPQPSSLGTNAGAVGGALREAGNRSASSTFNYQPTHNNQDTNLDRLLREEGSTMRKWFRNEVRNNRFGMIGEPAQ